MNCHSDQADLLKSSPNDSHIVLGVKKAFLPPQVARLAIWLYQDGADWTTLIVEWVPLSALFSLAVYFPPELADLGSYVIPLKFSLPFFSSFFNHDLYQQLVFLNKLLTYLFGPSFTLTHRTNINQQSLLFKKKPKKAASLSPQVRHTIPLFNCKS